MPWLNGRRLNDIPFWSTLLGYFILSSSVRRKLLFLDCCWVLDISERLLEFDNKAREGAFVTTKSTQGLDYGHSLKFWWIIFWITHTKCLITWDLLMRHECTLCPTMVHERTKRDININEVENICPVEAPRSLTLMNYNYKTIKIANII